MKQILLNIVPYFQSFIYKNKCVCCCQLAYNGICNDCLEEIGFNKYEPTKYIHSIPVYCAGEYSNNLRKMILALKFQQKRELSRTIVRLLYTYWQETNLSKANFIVVPIPIHKNKKKERGFDQTDIIARKFALLAGYNYDNSILTRTKETLPQHSLTYEKRQKNLKNAFKINTTPPINAPLLLMDDICTTGSTIKEAITTLYNNNYFDITVLTVSYAKLYKTSSVQTLKL